MKAKAKCQRAVPASHAGLLTDAPPSSFHHRAPQNKQKEPEHVISPAQNTSGPCGEADTDNTKARHDNYFHLKDTLGLQLDSSLVSILLCIRVYFVHYEHGRGDSLYL